MFSICTENLVNSNLLFDEAECSLSNLFDGFFKYLFALEGYQYVDLLLSLEKSEGRQQSDVVSFYLSEFRTKISLIFL